MKRLVLPILVAIVVILTVFVGCTQPAPEPATPSQPAAGQSFKDMVSEPPPGLDSWQGTYSAEWESASIHRATVAEVPNAVAGNPFEGLGIRPDGTPYKIALCNHFLDCPWAAFAAGITEAYVAKAGADFVFFDAQFNVEAYNANFADIVEMGDVDGVMTCPVDAIPAISAVEKGRDAGIPTFCFGDEVPGPATLSTCVHDYVGISKKGGEMVNQYAEDRGETIDVFELWGHIGHLCAQQRHQGFHLATDPNSENVIVHESGNCEWTCTLAQDAVIDYFSTHPDWDAIYDMGNMVGGAIEGLRTIGMLYPVGHPEHIFLVATDAAPEAVQGLRDGYVDFIIGHSPWEEVDGAFKALLQYVCLGNSVERVYFCREYLVTHDTVDNPLIWGNIMLEGTPNYSQLPVLDEPDLIAMPTK